MVSWRLMIDMSCLGSLKVHIRITLYHRTIAKRSDIISQLQFYPCLRHRQSQMELTYNDRIQFSLINITYKIMFSVFYLQLIDKEQFKKVLEVQERLNNAKKYWLHSDVDELR